MIISDGEPTQYIVAPLIDRKLKDRFLYRKKYQMI